MAENSELVEQYEMRISRLTVDKLGVKLYDKISAVVAELVANAYDADAEKVTVRLPLSSALATRTKEGIDEKGYTVEVIDTGHGMTPREAQKFYMKVGRDRREHEEQGRYSREKNRAVMGRKGIGKLAPFGVCRRIEVISAGGEETDDGYLVTHFFMDYNEILSDTDEPVKLEHGDLDATYREKRGTTVRLSHFLPKRVPGPETFHRQLASRFAFAEPDFEIWVEDTRRPDENPPKKVEPLSIPIVDETKINLSERPVTTEGGEELPVQGWLAMAKNPYKNEEMAGVRIYARNKIVATTRDFEQPAGFTGEFTVRSYLVGEVHAEWLDKDDGEDLIRSDRQGIIWESEYGRALREWGADLIKEIGRRSRKPRRKRVRKKFMDVADFETQVKERFKDDSVRQAALEIADQIGGLAAEDELEDPVYIEDLSEIILSVAPHRALLGAFREFSNAAEKGDISLQQLTDLFDKVSVAEIASYSQIASERVKAIRELEKIVYQNESESKFQELIADAPWLIEPTWSVITENQALKTFKVAFEKFWEKRTGEDLTLAIGFEKKRPDFTLINVGHRLHIVEIKKSGHNFGNSDFERLENYVYAFEDFFEENEAFKREFPAGWRIDLIADGVNITNRSNERLYNIFVEEGQVKRISWTDFLTRARNAHEMFLKASEEASAG